MRSFSPESSEWLHYEASEAALKRAADALQATQDNLRSLRQQFPGVDESPEYAGLKTELKRELDKQIERVLERVCQHASRMDRLAAKNRASEAVPASETAIPVFSPEKWSRRSALRRRPAR